MRPSLSRLRAHPWVIGIGVGVIVAGASAGAYFGTRDDSAAAALATGSTTTQTVGTGTVRQSVSATGTLAPAKQENLDFAASGTVTSVSVSAGAKVRKGQALATIDSASLAAAVAQARATVAGDKATVDADATNGADDTRTAADKAALTAARHQLDSAKKQRAAATLTSPIAGVVASVNLTVGQTVSGGSASNSQGASGDSATGDATSGGGNTSSSPQILVISTDSWVANASVDDTSVGLISTGDQAQLTVDGSDSTVYGTIGSIGLVSSSTSGTASYPVTIDVTGSPSGLHDGANVTATLIYKQVSGVPVVPTTALHRAASGGRYVEKVTPRGTVRTTVTVGISSAGRTQIVSGLSAGDRIEVPQLRIGNGTGSSGQRGKGAFSGGFPGRGGGEFPGGGFPGGAQGQRFGNGGQGG